MFNLTKLLLMFKSTFDLWSGSHRFMKFILKTRDAPSPFHYVWISTLRNCYSCINRPLLYAHEIINLCHSFFKPRDGWCSALQNYYLCISWPLIYAHQIINLCHSFLKPRDGWCSALQNYYLCISRLLIYAHQIINLCHSFFKRRVAFCFVQTKDMNGLR